MKPSIIRTELALTTNVLTTNVLLLWFIYECEVRILMSYNPYQWRQHSAFWTEKECLERQDWLKNAIQGQPSRDLQMRIVESQVWVWKDLDNFVKELRPQWTLEVRFPRKRWYH